MKRNLLSVGLCFAQSDSGVGRFLHGVEFQKQWIRGLNSYFVKPDSAFERTWSRGRNFTHLRSNDKSLSVIFVCNSCDMILEHRRSSFKSAI